MIQLLKDLSVQAKQEGETEAATYQKFTYWCKKSDRKLHRAIKKEKKGIFTVLLSKYHNYKVIKRTRRMIKKMQRSPARNRNTNSTPGRHSK